MKRVPRRFRAIVGVFIGVCAAAFLIAFFFSAKTQKEIILSPENDCKTIHSTPGCSNLNCSNSVCEHDSYCCEKKWDSFCADRAKKDNNC